MCNLTVDIAYIRKYYVQAIIRKRDKHGKDRF